MVSLPDFFKRLLWSLCIALFWQMSCRMFEHSVEHPPLFSEVFGKKISVSFCRGNSPATLEKSSSSGMSYPAPPPKASSQFFGGNQTARHRPGCQKFPSMEASPQKCRSLVDIFRVVGGILEWSCEWHVCFSLCFRQSHPSLLWILWICGCKTTLTKRSRETYE